MSGVTTAIFPLRDFGGMSRLANTLNASQRKELTRSLADLAVSAARSVGVACLIVSSDKEVRDWAAMVEVPTIDDSGNGLSEAAHTATRSLGGTPWMVVHPDLPLIDGDVLLPVAQLAERNLVLVPSHDGGTNVVASSGEFPFSYGIGSFHRHLAARPNAIVISNAELAVDLDSPAQLAHFPALINRSTLTS
jgi:2-phospho-L-lactate guanylyltransferase